jgi:hypothetical protein
VNRGRGARYAGIGEYAGAHAMVDGEPSETLSDRGVGDEYSTI